MKAKQGAVGGRRDGYLRNLRNDYDRAFTIETLMPSITSVTASNLRFTPLLRASLIPRYYLLLRALRASFWAWRFYETAAIHGRTMREHPVGVQVFRRLRQSG